MLNNFIQKLSRSTLVFIFLVLISDSAKAQNMEFANIDPIKEKWDIEKVVIWNRYTGKMNFVDKELEEGRIDRSFADSMINVWNDDINLHFPYLILNLSDTSDFPGIKIKFYDGRMEVIYSDAFHEKEDMQIVNGQVYLKKYLYVDLDGLYKMVLISNKGKKNTYWVKYDKYQPF